MKKCGFLLLLLFIGVACGNNTDSNNNPTNNPDGPKLTKKIQAGDSLFFLCPDTLRRTELELTSVWQNNSSTWLVSLNEFDRSGKLVFAIKNLVGKPDSIESLHMNINQGSTLFAKVSQNGQTEAIYKDSNRILNCTFE